MKKLIICLLACLLFLTSCQSDQDFKGSQADGLEWKDETNIIVDLKGEVNMPGIYTFNKSVRLYEAINLAGGFTKDAETSGLNLALMITEDQMIYIPSVSIETQASNKISINRGTIAELCKIPGVGEGRAQKIIDYRKIKPFNKIEDLKNVSGIGEETFNKIKPYICL